MKLKSVIGCIITCLLFTSPVLSMNLRDTKPQQDVLQVPMQQRAGIICSNMFDNKGYEKYYSYICSFGNVRFMYTGE